MNDKSKQILSMIDGIETSDLDSVLKPFLTNGIIDSDDYSQIKEIMTRKEILFKHQANSKIAQHKDGR